MQGKNSFIGLNARNVLGQVGRFGENIAASLLKGETVDDHSESTPFADVVNWRSHLAIQVKMCNGRHAQRPLPQQIVGLFEEIKNPFLFDKGVYVFIFYRGVFSGNKGHADGKSKIWSRKFSRGMRRGIIARELQYIFILDVRLLRYMINHSQFLKRGAIVYIPEDKPNRNQVLYLNRTFMKGFPERRESHRQLLDTVFGQKSWHVKTINKNLHFTDGVESMLDKTVPVHIIGSRQTVRSVVSVVRRAIPSVDLEYDASTGPSSNTPPQ